MSNRENRPGGPIDVQGTESKNKGSFKDLGKGIRQDKSNGNLGSTRQQNVTDEESDTDMKKY